MSTLCSYDEIYKICTSHFDLLPYNDSETKFTIIVSCVMSSFRIKSRLLYIVTTQEHLNDCGTFYFSFFI
ncbi:unnamed protein product [Angiostrongylus costaricensis]|uniref:Ovule protein n=1 Tax=Angiostrongylus costaricensis TaxID=334426 RepID=A0A0R3P9F2_ANGCS|nr:unnamed protein product [Angiostrongylus costaricensis]